MTDFDIDLAGMESVQEELERIEDDVETDQVVETVSTADYSRPLEFGRGPVTPQSADALKFEINGETVFAQSVSGHPPYPFFRPAIREFKANPNAFVRDNKGFSIGDAQSIEQALWWIAQSLEQQMKLNVTPNAGDRSPGTHPDHPQVDTGNLRQGIKARRL